MMTGEPESIEPVNSAVSRSSDSEPPWMQPFERFMTYIDETETLIHVHIHALGQSIAWPEFLSEALQVSEDRELLVSARRIAKDAKHEWDRDFPLIHAHAVLGLWSALEAAVEDLLVAWLVANPET